MMNGIWGTISVGLFATPTAPDSELTGLFYGGGFGLLGKQLLGQKENPSISATGEGKIELIIN
jgi:ammonia channel protein AmtB